MSKKSDNRDLVVFKVVVDAPTKSESSIGEVELKVALPDSKRLNFGEVESSVKEFFSRMGRDVLEVTSIKRDDYLTILDPDVETVYVLDFDDEN